MNISNGGIYNVFITKSGIYTMYKTKSGIYPLTVQTVEYIYMYYVYFK